MAKAKLSAARKAYLNNRTASNPTIALSVARRHNRWLAMFLEGKPLEEHRFRALAGVPGDDEFIAANKDNPLLCRKEGDRWFGNILLPAAHLSPSAKEANTAASISEFSALADEVIAGALDPVRDLELPEDVLERVANLIHEAWRKREGAYRRGKDAEFDRLDIPYSELGKLADGQAQMDKDREPAHSMWANMRRDCPK